MTTNKEKYPIGTTVYYSIEDYDTGKSIIYEGKITKIYHKKLKLQDTELNIKLYQVNEGMSMQSNAFYTLEELFQLKERLEVLSQEFTKQALIKDVSDYEKDS